MTVFAASFGLGLVFGLIVGFLAAVLFLAVEAVSHSREAVTEEASIND